MAHDLLVKTWHTDKVPDSTSVRSCLVSKSVVGICPLLHMATNMSQYARTPQKEGYLMHGVHETLLVNLHHLQGPYDIGTWITSYVPAYTYMYVRVHAYHTLVTRHVIPTHHFNNTVNEKSTVHAHKWPTECPQLPHPLTTLL